MSTLKLMIWDEARYAISRGDNVTSLISTRQTCCFCCEDALRRFPLAAFPIMKGADQHRIIKHDGEKMKKKLMKLLTICFDSILKEWDGPVGTGRTKYWFPDVPAFRTRPRLCVSVVKDQL